MLDLIYESGPLTIGIITIIFLIILILSYLNGRLVIRNNSQKMASHRNSINHIKSLGFLALVIGIFGQLIGLYGAFSAMTSLEGGISTQILIAGLKASTVSTLYGMVIYIIAYLIWLGLSWRLSVE